MSPAQYRAVVCRTIDAMIVRGELNSHRGKLTLNVGTPSRRNCRVPMCGKRACVAAGAKFRCTDHWREYKVRGET